MDRRNRNRLAMTAFCRLAPVKNRRRSTWSSCLKSTLSLREVERGGGHPENPWIVGDPQGRTRQRPIIGQVPNVPAH